MIRGWKRRIAACLLAILITTAVLGDWLHDDIDSSSGSFLRFFTFSHEPSVSHFPPGASAPTRPPLATLQHPIDELIRDARAAFDELLTTRSTTLGEAARRYRERRGRHPPPGFDKWFASAAKSDAVIVEDFFDRIHHDINPLWAIEPRQLRLRTHNQPHLLRVRNGRARAHSEAKDVPYRVEQWERLVREIMPNIPDLDMALNTMDESRIMVPWETVRDYVAQERRDRRLIDVKDATSEYAGVGDDVEASTDRYDPVWIQGQTNKFWDLLSVACPPGTAGRDAAALPSFDVPVEFPAAVPTAYTYKGYVQNFTASQDPCLQAHLRGMHGTFIDSISMSTTRELLPMFGECKLPQNNEMLIPGAVYLDSRWAKYSGGGARGGDWAAKKDALVWRGTASGARNKKDNWWHIHRNRFLQMLNATTVAAREANDEHEAPTFRLEPSRPYGVATRKGGSLSQWLSTFADVGYIDILCDPPEEFTHWWRGKLHKLTCSWLEPWFSLADRISMKEQYDYKYLPDIDGNSFSGRYRAFLLSSSLPLKSTIYAEWHDDRLFPWVHFVPFDNSFIDIYGVMDYFLDGHDTEAETMATEGQKWAESVLRREDMRLYVWRLLLEYARAVDDNRDRLAFVADLEMQ